MLEDADSNEQGKKQRQRYCPGVQAERKSAFLVFDGKISRLDSQGFDSPFKQILPIGLGHGLPFSLGG